MLSPIAATHVQQPRNRGELATFTHRGISGEKGDGPYVIIWLRVTADVVEDASYETYGCPSSVAAASMTVALVKARNVEAALRLTAEDLLVVLGGLPDGKGFMATMSIEALRNALEEKK